MTKDTAPVHRRRWYAFLTSVLVMVVLASPQHYIDDFHSPNEALRIYATMALVDHGTLHIDPVFDQYFPGWKAAEFLPNEDAAFRDGHYLLDKAPGISLLSVPVLAFFRVTGIEIGYARLAWLLSVLFSALPTLLFLVILERWLRRSFGDDSRARLMAACTVLATPWLIYSALLFGHALAASLVGTGVILALGPLTTAENGHRTRGGLLGGLCLGAAVLVEYPCAFVAVFVCLAVVVDAHRRHRLPWIILGGLGPALLLLTWNTVAFGGPFSFSYGFKADPAMAADHAKGLYGLSLPNTDVLYGLLLSPRRGLFFLAPWLISGLLGAVWFCRDRGVSHSWRTMLPLGVLGVPLLVGGFDGRHGGACLGPRLLLFGLPFWGISAALAVDRLAKHRLAPFFLGSLAGLIFSSMVLNLSGHIGFPYISHDVANPVFEVVIPVLLNGGPSPTIWSTVIGPYGFALMVLAYLALVTHLAWVAVRPATEAAEGHKSAPGRTGRRLIPATLLAAALTAHLVVGTIPRTENVNLTRHLQIFAHDMQCFPELTPSHCEAKERLLRSR